MPPPVAKVPPSVAKAPPPPPRVRPLRSISGGRAMAPAPPLPVTEDTPPDMLAGSMDLRVVLPGGRAVKMSAERCTPMMDLLVQVTTANKMAPGGFVLQPVGERGVLPYKPSTPIGALDTWTIQIVPKARTLSTNSLKKAPLKPSNQQPFEQTFRLQVHLPRNQLFVTRISPKSLLSDILTLACSEKNLDPNKYELRHPANLEERLKPEWTLADYKLQEVTLVAKGNRPLGSGLSSSDIMALQKEEEKRRQHARANGGTGSVVLGLMLGKNSQSSGCEGSISSDSLGGRSISPARSDETPSPPGSSLPPPRPTRKRRPAPKPPTQVAQPIPPQAAVISHSRNSSDSSGYHEASILSEGPESNGLSSPSGTLPRRSKLTNSPAPPTNVTTNHNLSRSLSNLAHMNNNDHKHGQLSSNMKKNGHSVSTTSLASSGHGKKKKAPPPPPSRSNTPGQLAAEKRTASLSTLSSQSSGDSFERELYSRSATLERPSSSQSSTISNFMRHEILSEEVAVDEVDSISSSQDDYSQKSTEAIQETSRTSMSEKEDSIEPQLSSCELTKEVQNPTLTKIASSSQEVKFSCSEDKTSTPTTPLKEIKTDSSANLKHYKKSAPELRKEFPVPESKQRNDLIAIHPSNIASPRSSLPDVVSGLQKDSEEIQKEFEAVTNELETVILAEEAKQNQTSSLSNLQSPKAVSPSPSLADWEYHLPAPPSAFRDSQSPVSSVEESENLSNIPMSEEIIAEVLPPAEFTDVDKLLDESRMTSLMIAKECPLIQNLVKGVTKVNPLFNNNKYEAEIFEDLQGQSKDNFTSPGNGISSDDWKPAELKNSNLTPELQEENNSHYLSVCENNQVNHLKNFTISTYLSPQDNDIVYNGVREEKKEFDFKKPMSVTTNQNASVNSISANLPRNNSFSAKNPIHMDRSFVKRSTSHVSLANSGRTVRAKSIGNLASEASREEYGSHISDRRSKERSESLRKTTSEANINQDYGRRSRLAELQDQFLQWQEQLLLETQPDIPLQSLQVLRSILSPSQERSHEKIQKERSSSTERDHLSEPRNEEDSESFNPNEVQLRRNTSNTSNVIKRYSYQGPPAVNFSTWNERPRSQVSIKVDNDYRIGKGQNFVSSTLIKESQPIEGKTEIIEKKELENRKINPNTLSRSESLTQVNGHMKVEPTALTMRIISHTTPSGYKKANSVTSNFTTSQDADQAEKESTPTHHTLSRAHSYSSAQIADPSRVPIVRAMELKKSVLQGKQIDGVLESNPSPPRVKMSWNETNNQQVKILNEAKTEDEDAEEKFQGVNNLAKRFSQAASRTENVKPNQLIRPLSAYSYSEPKPKTLLETKKNCVNISSMKDTSSANGLTNAKKFTSVVGINGVESMGGFKEPSVEVKKLPPKVIVTSSATKPIINPTSKSSTILNNVRHPMPVVKGFRFATQNYSDSSLVAAESYKVSSTQHPTTVNVQHSNSFVSSNQRNPVEAVPSVSVRIQPSTAPKPSQVLLNEKESIIAPSAPPLPKKTVSRPKSFPAPEINARDQLMDAIRSFGGRGNLRQTNGS